MIVYNVTVSIDESAEKEWLTWMKEVHVPDVLATQHFQGCKICRVIGDEEGGKTYAIMYTALSLEDLENYQKNHAPRLQKEHTEKFSGRFVAFRTLLNVLHEY